MRHFLSDHSNTFREVEAFPLNRAMLFGDGIFETMVYLYGTIRFGNAHQERLSNGMTALGLQGDVPPAVEKIARLVSTQFGSDKALRLRWTVFRAGKGTYTPTEEGFGQWLTVADFHPAPAVKKSAYISEAVRVPYSSWANCKTLNALPYVMANLERQKKKQDEVLLLDQNGFLSEAGSSNLFWLKNGKIFTPALKHACVAGVARKQILEQFRKRGFPAIEGSFRAQEVLHAEKVFVSNASGISYLKQINGIAFDTQALPELVALFESNSVA
ncbi:aminotransferase class IV [Cyclobacterium xiamenense]|uniref:aminotransferase class IV n=1 Tax=Cyclobacterium xiamenense TaxID=1297121 RepID=UPI0035CEDF39